MALIDDIHARMNEILADRVLGADVYYRAPEDRRLEGDLADLREKCGFVK